MTMRLNAVPTGKYQIVATAQTRTTHQPDAGRTPSARASPSQAAVLIHSPTDERCQRMRNSGTQSVGTFHPLANNPASTSSPRLRLVFSLSWRTREHRGRCGGAVYSAVQPPAFLCVTPRPLLLCAEQASHAKKSGLRDFPPAAGLWMRRRPN